MGHQHTPGPWFNAGLMIRKQTSEKGGSFALAKVIDHEWLEMGDTDANARLIAAAPELLDALIELVDVSSSVLTSTHSRARVDAARAAINKALGG